MISNLPVLLLNQNERQIRSSQKNLSAFLGSSPPLGPSSRRSWWSMPSLSLSLSLDRWIGSTGVAVAWPSTAMAQLVGFSHRDRFFFVCTRPCCRSTYRVWLVGWWFSAGRATKEVCSAPRIAGTGGPPRRSPSHPSTLPLLPEPGSLSRSPLALPPTASPDPTPCSLLAALVVPTAIHDERRSDLLNTTTTSW